MTTSALKGLGKLSLALLLAASLNGVAFAGVAPVEGSVAMKSPSGNAAVVAKLIGLVNNRVEKTLTGTARTINDGVVIRQSYIKDGKIIIPAEGLYTTARSSNWYPFDNEPITINGKTYRVIVDRYVRDVVRNVVMKKGQVITSNADKSRGWELTSVGGWTSFGMAGAGTATFKIVKTTGNYYGTAFPVQVGPMIADTVATGSLIKGSKDVEGHVVPDAQNGLSRFIDGTSIATTGRSHVIVDKIDDKGSVHVRELATDSCTDLFISASDPVVSSYAEGASFKVNGAEVAVKKLGKDSVEVSITDKSGAVASKKLYIDSENAQWLVMSMTERENCYLVSQDGKTLVHLNIRPGNPFKDGKVELVAYSDVVRVQNGTDWVSDARFLARPETWASCTFPHEVMVANKAPIVLDGGANNVFVGPDNQFKIVIDEFDGKTVKAWHVETAKAKTGNLATRAQGKNIDLVIGKACRSTVHFISRWYGKMYDEHLRGNDVFK